MVEETSKQPLLEDNDKFQSTDNLVNDEVVEQPAHEVLSDKSEIFVKMEKVTDTKTEILWQCTLCEKVMKHDLKLISLIEVHLDGRSRIFKCGICNKTQIKTEHPCMFT